MWLFSTTEKNRLLVHAIKGAALMLLPRYYECLASWFCLNWVMGSQVTSVGDTYGNNLIIFYSSGSEPSYTGDARCHLYNAYLYFDMPIPISRIRIEQSDTLHS